MLELNWIVLLYFAMTFSAVTLVWIMGTLMIEHLSHIKDKRHDRD